MLSTSSPNAHLGIILSLGLRLSVSFGLGLGLSLGLGLTPGLILGPSAPASATSDWQAGEDKHYV